METSKCYAESPVLAVLGVYLDYNICVWRRATRSSTNLNFACLFSAKTQSRQIHVLLDGAADSIRALDGHFSLVTDYTFSTGANRWGCGKIPMDFRLGLHLESNPIDLVNIPDPEVEEQIPSPHLSPTNETALQQQPPLPPLTTHGHALRPRSVGNICNIVLQAQPVTAPPVVPVPTSSYGLGHTDGGRRDITVKTKGSKAKPLKDVGGWAFQLLCSRGERYVGSSSLGPNSTNNIGEFTTGNLC